MSYPRSHRSDAEQANAAQGMITLWSSVIIPAWLMVRNTSSSSAREIRC
ncbi:MAG: hypothetical protein AVDCRST_MAG26-1454 [uncultured Chloroflexia bacterium]|uniref:Uncharacterized protein n=1 Tax=uncultured Chloroflexia bacterium TaxID=1672391 RepID=A0A6J4I377_9CHLR|nr:MAG: hypothetical protein AVDCRST_MAG26-1454 [uncultured Chloroflexia bacterium]